MANIERRIFALEAKTAPNECREIELCAGPSISVSEAKMVPQQEYRPGDVVTRIVLVGVRPDHDGVW